MGLCMAQTSRLVQPLAEKLITNCRQIMVYTYCLASWGASQLLSQGKGEGLGNCCSS